MEESALELVLRPIFASRTKACCNCNIKLTHNNIRLHPGSDELQFLCEQCFISEQKLKDLRKIEHKRQYQQAYKARNKDKMRNYHIRYKDKARQNRIKNKEKIQLRSYEYYRRNKEQLLEQADSRRRQIRMTVANDPSLWKEYRLARILPGLKARAKAKGVDFDLTLDYLLSIAADHCPVDGLPMHWRVDAVLSKKTSPRSPSVDRLLPSRGYVKGNVQIICFQYNTWKRDMTLQDMQLLLAYFQEVQP